MSPKPLLILTLSILSLSARSQSTNKQGFIQVRNSVDQRTAKKIISLVQEKEQSSIHLKYHAADEAHFYLFDLQGTLVYQATVKKWESKIIKNIDKGVYTYSVFINDEGVEDGKLTVK